MRGLRSRRRGVRQASGWVAGAALALAALPACGSDKDEATAAGKDFLAAWAAGDLQRAGALTDAGDAATKGLEEVTSRLSVTATRLEPGTRQKGKGSGSATLPFHVRLTLKALGTWSYDSTLPLTKRGDGWRVHWSPAVIHPQLTDGTRLRRTRELPPRAAILGGDGKPLVTDRPVTTVGVWPAKLTDPDRAYAVLGPLGVDTSKLATRVKAAKPDAFVEVITLRDADYAQVRDELRAVPGLVFHTGTRALAPTPAFARAVLGSVSPATKETLENAGETASASDLVGASGLQLAFQKQLAGTPGGKVEIVDRTDPTKEPVTVHSFTGQPGKPLRTTLDLVTQTAAEAALADVRKPSALVAVKPSTGAVLAAANGPGGSAYNRAFVGRYPPGSTFKVVTTAALLAAGLRPDATVACPETVTVSGKKFENTDSLGSLGSVPFRQDFAHSCNTAFIGLRGRLTDTALPDAAAAFGIGGDWTVGLPAFSGSVPAPASEVERAADMIGQGKVEASPLAMAAVAATVAAGTFHQPFVLPDSAARFTATRRLPRTAVTQLRALMRAVVTEGSGKALRGLPGSPAAKTGTAEFGTATPPHTHAWMIGYRGDLAFAVLIEDGGGGGKNAGPVAAKFLSALR